MNLDPKNGHIWPRYTKPGHIRLPVRRMCDLPARASPAHANVLSGPCGLKGQACHVSWTYRQDFEQNWPECAPFGVLLTSKRGHKRPLSGWIYTIRLPWVGVLPFMYRSTVSSGHDTVLTVLHILWPLVGNVNLISIVRRAGARKYPLLTSI